MGNAYIVDACRAPRGIGKVGKGALAHLHPSYLGSTVLAQWLSETISIPLRLMTLSGERPRKVASRAVTWSHGGTECRL